MSNKSVETNSKAVTVSDKKNVPTEKKSSESVKATKETNKETKPSKNKPHEKKKTRKIHSSITAITVCIGLSAAGLAGYDYWILKNQVTANIQLTKTQQDLQSRVDQLGQQLQISKLDLVKEVRARESAQAEHQALSTAMQNVSAKLGRSTAAWRMAEVEYLLTVANHRLTLAQDRETAIVIFETADERIKAIGDTALLKVRKVLADELLALQAMPEVDIAGLALRVGSLVNSVEQLPLLDKKRIAVAMNDNADNTPESWQQLPMAVWNDLKSLVQVRRHQQPTEPLLPPDQTQHLYQNLTLKLEQARLAVLRRDTALFQQHLNEAVSWLTHYFEVESPIVVNAVASLKSMLTIELQPAVPDVGRSLRMLREVMKGQRAETGVKHTQAQKK